MEEPAAQAGAIEPRVAVEFPGLALRWTAVRTRGGPSPASLRGRLREMADRGRGAQVVSMRTQPVAHAYRAFYRQTGLDPDVTRIASEAVAVRRLLDGGFRSQGRIADALLVALVETGVPVWALRRDLTEPDTLAIRISRAGEATGGGRLVLADARRVHGILFGAAGSAAPAGGRDQDLVLVCVGVDGVPAVFLEEALWLCTEILADD